MKNFLKWFWPVKTHELNIFLPLFLMKLCISFNYSILATIKDTIVVTTSGAGAEIIPVLKGGVVIVCAFLVMLAYSKMNNYISRRNMFYVMMLPFLVFFLLYGFVLYPYRDLLSPTTSADWLLQQVGAQHQHWVAVYRYWMHALFFVVAEMWGGVVIGLLFWGFVNQITNIRDAARFYVLYSTGGHLGSLLSGGTILACTTFLKHHNYQLIINVLMVLVTTVGVTIIALYKHANKNLQIEAHNSLNSFASLAKKSKHSLRSSILYIMRSPYLWLLATMVICYGLSVNLVEVAWKSLVKQQYSDPTQYQRFMGLLQMILGTTSLVLALGFSGGIMRKFGWYISAQLTPIVLGTCSLVFFALFFMFPHLQESNIAILGCSPLFLLVICGAIHNIACKAMKYCFFDPTKEMAYIPLDSESKTKGKAAVDLVGARFGKTGSSWIQILLIDFVGGGSILSVVPLLVPVIVIVVGMWIKAVFNINKLFNKSQQPLDNTNALESPNQA